MNAAAVVAGSLAAVSAAVAVAGASQRSNPVLPAALPGASAADPGGRLRGAFARVGSSSVGRLLGRGSTDPEPAEGGSWSGEEVAGAKLLAPVALGVLPLLAPPPLPFVAPLVAVAAFRLPGLLLARTARRRAGVAARELPVFLDLLAVATSAGLAPQLAVREAVVAVRGPLGEELRAALRAADLGARWRDEFRAAARRLRLPELVRTASVLARSETLGSSMADEVARLAIDVRETRRADATERARTAPVKMLFPLVFLILPAFLLLTVVPVLLTTVRSIG